MGRKFGYCFHCWFIIFTFLSIALTIYARLSIEATITLVVVSLLTWTTTFFIPGIYFLKGIVVKDRIKFLYAILIVTLFFFLIYTIIMINVAQTNFLAQFLMFSPIALGISALIAFFAVCFAYHEEF